MKKDFLSFALSAGVLKFGEFKLKSGRLSPYFFNAGGFDNGYLLQKLGRFYAHTIKQQMDDDFMLFGPAYKGIPLACATAIALADEYNMQIPFAFDRKEAKDHGEGGSIVGAPLSGKVVIIDDVITAGLSVGHSVRLIKEHGAEPMAVVIALDRQEKCKDGNASAVQSVQKQFGLPVYAVATLQDLLDFVVGDTRFEEHYNNIKTYQAQYGV